MKTTHRTSTLRRLAVLQVALGAACALGAAGPLESASLANPKPSPAAAATLSDHGSATSARDRFQRGEKLVRDGRYAEALAEFSAGHTQSQRPLFLFNMAECARLAGDLGQAAELYQRYLGADPGGRMARQAQERLAALGQAAASGKPGGPATARPRPAAAGAVASPGNPAAPGSAHGHESRSGVAMGPQAAPTAVGRSRGQGQAPASRLTLEVPGSAAEQAAAGAPQATLAAAPTAALPATEGDSRPRSKPVWKRWPLWVGIGAALVAGSVTAAVLTQRGKGEPGCSGAHCVVLDMR